MTCCDHSLPIIPCWSSPPQFWYHAKVAFVIPYCFALLLWQAESASCSSQPCPVMCVYMTPLLCSHFVNWVLFLHKWIDLSAHARFVLYSGSVDECGSLLGTRSISSSMYLTGLRSVIRSSHTRYMQLETKIKDISESDPIAHCYIWDKSRTETVTQVNLERD